MYPVENIGLADTQNLSINIKELSSNFGTLMEWVTSVFGPPTSFINLTHVNRIEYAIKPRLEGNVYNSIWVDENENESLSTFAIPSKYIP